MTGKSWRGSLCWRGLFGVSFISFLFMAGCAPSAGQHTGAVPQEHTGPISTDITAVPPGSTTLSILKDKQDCDSVSHFDAKLFVQCMQTRGYSVAVYGPDHQRTTIDALYSSGAGSAGRLQGQKSQETQQVPPLKSNPPGNSSMQSSTPMPAPHAVVTNGTVPYYWGYVVGNSPPIGQFAAGTHLCVETWFKDLPDKVHFILPGIGGVEAAYNPGTFARDPSSDAACMEKIQQQQLSAPFIVPDSVTNPTLRADIEQAIGYWRSQIPLMLQGKAALNSSLKNISDDPGATQIRTKDEIASTFFSRYANTDTDLTQTWQGPFPWLPAKKSNDFETARRWYQLELNQLPEVDFSCRSKCPDLDYMRRYENASTATRYLQGMLAKCDAELSDPVDNRRKRYEAENRRISSLLEKRKNVGDNICFPNGVSIGPVDRVEGDNVVVIWHWHRNAVLYNAGGFGWLQTARDWDQNLIEPYNAVIVCPH